MLRLETLSTRNIFCSLIPPAVPRLEPFLLRKLLLATNFSEDAIERSSERPAAKVKAVKPYEDTTMYDSSPTLPQPSDRVDAMVVANVQVLNNVLPSASKTASRSVAVLLSAPPGARPRKPAPAQASSALRATPAGCAQVNRYPLAFTVTRGRMTWRGRTQSAANDADEVAEAYAAVERASKLIDEILQEMSDAVRSLHPRVKGVIKNGLR